MQGPFDLDMCSISPCMKQCEYRRGSQDLQGLQDLHLGHKETTWLVHVFDGVMTGRDEPNETRFIIHD